MNYQELILRAQKESFSDLEIYESNNRELSIAIYNGVVDKNELSQSSTLSIRAIYQGKMAYLDLENRNESIDFVLSNLKANALSLTTDETFSVFGGSESYPKLVKKQHDFYMHPNFEKINILKSLEQKIKQSDARIVFVPYCNYDEVETSIRIVNSQGLDIQKQKAYCAIVAQAVARENNDSQSGFRVDVNSRFDEIDIDHIVSDVVSKTVNLLNAKPVSSQPYSVIIENEAMGDLLASFQSIFSGEAAIKKITPLLGKENEVIMSEKVTITDDPLHQHSIHQEPFDDEGVACQTKNVVYNGVFKTFLHNLKTAKYFNTESTGNGFKTGSTISVSGVNLHVVPGIKSKNDLILSLNSGLLITSLQGLHAGVNPISGDFNLKASGYVINNGQIGRPVTLIVVSGNFFQLMREEVLEIANDLEFGYKSVLSPSILFKSLTISGE